MTPLFQITADGVDVTGKVADRLLELRLTDEAGYQADRLEMTLDDRGGTLKVPPHQSVVRVALGMAGARPVPLTAMGSWRTDETELTGPVRTLRLTATAADMSGAIRAPRTRAWENVTLKDLVASIAGEAGLIPVVAPALAGIVIRYLAQTAESDLNLLTRLARQNGAVLKPADGRLLLARRGVAETAKGEALTALALSTADMRRWNWRTGDRQKYGSAEASWSELGTARQNKVVIGEGAPRRTLRHVFGSEDEARRAAQAILDDAGRGAETGSLSMAGFYPSVFAGALLSVADLRGELGGDWLATRVTHSLTTSLTTEIDIERPSGAASQGS